MQLTSEQQQIVRHPSGHALVSAVAGSGKTTTMVARVQYLLEHGTAPDKLLVLMFNRSARDAFALAMKRRIAATGLPMPEVRTYHSLGLRLVESFTRRGVLPAYRLVTEEHIREKLAKQVLNSAYKEESGEHAWVTKEDLEEFLRFIDLVKSGIIPAAMCFEREKLPEKCTYFIEGFRRFEIARQQQRCRFYEDLIHEPLQAMLQDMELATWVSNRVEHIIVDEYQDINEVQQQLLKILAGDRASVMVVGDVDQCIYEWRGARPEYINSRFQHDFVAPARYTLSYTFRYGHRISLAANHLISRNRQRDRKQCLSAPGNFDTRIFRYEEEDRHPVLRIVAEWQQQGRSLTDGAVLVRLFGISVPFELALLEAAIPYRLEGHEQVFGCREIRALTGYLKVCNGTLDDHDPQIRAEYIHAMLTQPHLGIRQEELETLAFDIAADLKGAPERLLDLVNSDIPVFIRKKIAQAAEDWEWLLKRPPEILADRLLADILSRFDLYTFYQKFSSKQATAENRIETCRAFVDFAARQKLNVSAFLEKIEKLQHSGSAEPKVARGDELLITSIHRAKGREWPLVIIPGLKDGLFPFMAEAGTGDDTMEDERRLFYVAITRGIERVALIHPSDHLLKKRSELGAGDHPVEAMRASRFLYEANLGLSDQVGAAIGDPQAASLQTITAVETEVANTYLRGIASTVSPVQTRVSTGRESRNVLHTLRISDLAAGVKVVHRSFGNGVIVEVLARNQGRIRVQFAEFGEKTLLLSFAPLMLQP